MFLCDTGFVGVLTSAMGRECAESAGVRAHRPRTSLVGTGPQGLQCPRGPRRMRVCGPHTSVQGAKTSHAKAQARELGFCGYVSVAYLEQ